MKKLIFTFISILVINLSFSQGYSVRNHFSEVYKECPSIPKGILEAVSFSKSRMKHLKGSQENCNGMPKTIGIMGIIWDGGWSGWGP